jgi:hypothetical protein
VVTFFCDGGELVHEADIITCQNDTKCIKQLDQKRCCTAKCSSINNLFDFCLKAKNVPILLSKQNSTFCCNNNCKIATDAIRCCRPKFDLTNKSCAFDIESKTVFCKKYDNEESTKNFGSSMLSKSIVTIDLSEKAEEVPLINPTTFIEYGQKKCNTFNDNNIETATCRTVELF